jgi:hypothetical protein
MVLWISRGKCRVDLWGEIIIIIRKTASTFHNGLTANNENLVFNFANNGDFTPRYPMWIKSPISSYEYSYFS